MRCGLLRLLCAALLGCACVDGGSLRLPELPSTTGARSMILAIETPEGSVQAAAVDLDDGGNIAVSLRDQDRLVAFLYAEPFAALGLREGPVSPGSGRSRPLPSGYTVLQATAGPQRQWAALPAGESLSAAVRALRLPSHEPIECLRLSGCVRLDAQGAYCALPCYEPPLPQPPAEPEPPRPPEPPALPRLTPCPAGWTVLVSGSEQLEQCQPPPSFGPPCPTGQWATALPPGRVLYVAPGGSGVGSATDPLGLVADALALAQPGDAIALAKGDFAEALTVSSSVALIGACASGPEATMLRTVRFTAPGGRMRDLRVQGTAAGPAVEVSAAGSSVLLTGLEISGGAPGLQVDAGARASLADSAVRGAMIGLQALQSGARVVAARVLLKDCSGHAASAGAGAISLEDSVVRGGGRGLTLSGDGSLELRRTVVRDTGDAAVRVEGSGTVRLTDVVVEHPAAGAGVGVLLGGRLEADRLLIDRPTKFGLWLQVAEGSVRDLVIRSPELTVDLDNGEGVVIDQSLLSLDRGRIEDALGAGVALLGYPEHIATARFRDLVVRRTRIRLPRYEAGRGIEGRNYSVVELERGLLEDNSGGGVFLDSRLLDAGMSRLVDVSVLGGLSGLETLTYNSVSLSRCEITGSRSAAVAVRGGVLQASDLKVLGAQGAGVQLQAGEFGAPLDPGSFKLERVHIEDSGAEGLLVLGGDGLPRPSLEVTDLRVQGSFDSGVVLRECEVPRLSRLAVDSAFGLGLCSYGTQLSATDVEISTTVPNFQGIARCGSVTAVPGVSAVHLLGPETASGGVPPVTELRVFRVSGTMGRGLSIADAAVARLHQGLIEHCRVGVELYPGASLTAQTLDDEVVLRDNEEIYFAP